MYALHYREQLSPPDAAEWDDFIGWLTNFFAVSFNEDGSLKLGSITGNSSVTNNNVGGTTINEGNSSSISITQQIQNAEGHHWTLGPWIFDSVAQSDAFIPTPNIPAGTYNDFTVGGIDTAIGIRMFLGGDVTLTGLQAGPGNYRRLLVLRNQSASYTLTLKHKDTSSQPLNQFVLPGNVDITCSENQTVWLYYDNDNGVWSCFITPNASGGIAGAGGAGTGDVTGPGSSTTNDIAVFADTTGKLLADGGYTIAQILGSSLQFGPEVTWLGSDIEAGTTMTAATGVSGKIIVPLAVMVRTNFTVTAGGYNTSRDLHVRYATGATTVPLITESNTAIHSSATADYRLIMLNAAANTFGTNSEDGVNVNFIPSGALTFLGVPPDNNYYRAQLVYLLMPTPTS